MHLWGALADYVRAHGIEVLFGTASFHGTDVANDLCDESYYWPSSEPPCDPEYEHRFCL